jgi:quinol monooxygenase YgiN
VAIQAKPGEGDRMLEVLNSIMPDTVGADGAIGAETMRDSDDSDKFITVGRWRDRAAHEAYMAWRERTGKGHTELAPLMQNVVISYCATVGDWVSPAAATATSS